jgi:hypothetical protein
MLTQRRSRAREWTASLSGHGRSLKHMNHPREQADPPLWKVMEKCRELIICIGTEASKALRSAS